MNKSFFSWLLGITMIVAAPFAMADGNKQHKWKHVENHKQKHHAKRAYNKHKTKKFVKAETRRNQHNRKHNQHNNRHNNVNEPRWTINFSSHSPYRFISDNYYNDRHHYNNHENRRSSIHDRRANQRKRIRRGINKGQLVKFEIRQLRKQQRRIAHRIEDYRSDGHLNRHERAKIHKMLDRANNNIRRKRHNSHNRDRHHDSGQHNYYH